MKKHIKSTITIFINVVLIVSAILLYMMHTKMIAYRTEGGPEFAITLVILFSVISIILIYSIKKLRRYGLGVLAFMSSLLVYLFFTINKTSSDEEYQRFQQTGMLTIYDKDVSYYSTIEFGNRKIRTKVDVSKCFEFDSVDVKVINGLFGFKYFMDDTKIIESSDCLDFEADSLIDPIKIGVNYTKKRCFTSAINLYTRLIELEANNQNWYYNRGLNYLFKENYKLALNDFLIGATLFFNKHEDIQNIDVNRIIKDLMTNFDDQKFDNSMLKDIMSLDNFGKANDYMERIRFCVMKIKSA